MPGVMDLTGKRVVVTGGTGSLGRALVDRLLGDELGRPAAVVVFSRDETKQHAMRLQYGDGRAAAGARGEGQPGGPLEFVLGDLRDFHAVASVLRRADVVFNAAALKQVPTCEYYPFEAVQTNIIGAENLVRAIRENGLPVETVVDISSDKAAKPVSVMGMTKAIQERLFTAASLSGGPTRFLCVRYGNVLASRGSVIPLFHDQIRRGGPVTVTTETMTRFLLSMRQAVDTVFDALRAARPGETFVPRLRSARVVDLAQALIGQRAVDIEFTGIRPGEKTHEILISEEERRRTVRRGAYYVIQPILPELCHAGEPRAELAGEFSSATELMDGASLHALLAAEGLLVEDAESCHT